MPTLARGDRGSVMLETAAILLTFSMIIVGGFAVLYVAFARVWVDRQGYEALVCLASTAREFECERAFRKRVDYALPIGSLTHVRLSRSRDRAEVRFAFEIDGHPFVQHEDSRRLPLYSGSTR